MKKSEIKWQQFNMLQDVITEFGKNPYEKRSVTGERCKYMPPKYKPLSKGCAIGMYLSEEVAKKLDNETLSSINSVMNNNKARKLLPIWLQKMDVRFLTTLQRLHDNSGYWNVEKGEKGLTLDGVVKVHEMCERFDLPFKKLKI